MKLFNIVSKTCLILFFILAGHQLQAQKVPSTGQREIFWQVSGTDRIIWSLEQEKRLPHEDNIEMSGLQVAAIIRYRIDEQRQLRLSRDIIFPQLRRYIRSTEPDYYNYRAYLRDEYRDDLLPVITIAGKRVEPGPVDSVAIHGKISFYQHSRSGLSITRTLFPSMASRLFVEKWTLTNNTDTTMRLHVGHTTLHQEEAGLYGSYQRSIDSDADEQVVLSPGDSYPFGIYFSARLNDEPAVAKNFRQAEALRDRFLDSMRNNLVLDSPDSLLNTLFYFSKVHAAESIYLTKMGLVPSPGGGRYYTGIWANDQGEYCSPLFPYLGYSAGTEAAMNVYRMYLKNIPKDGGKIWASFEMDGDLPCCSKDRGDAAMLAFGATHFLLASGNKKYAAEIWPLVEWCLAYCEKKLTPEGIVASESDELEGRFPSGPANLSTSCLYYGGLRQAALLAVAMGKSRTAAENYNRRAALLSAAIERYFGATMDSLATYRYYQGNTALRSWICLPLVVGINLRKDGTLDALFGKLWTDNGVRVEADPTSKKPQLFWDRGTLYAFRGAFESGAADRALPKLDAFSRIRLTGFHVPYMVEAWPEGDMAHLSAESALYVRIFTEGILGLRPSGFRSFTLQPHLPAAWDHFSIRKLKAFNDDLDILLRRTAQGMSVSVLRGRQIILEKIIGPGEALPVDLR